MENGLQMTANFISNTMPGAISFSYPAPYARLTNATFSIEGRVAASEETDQVTVTCQVFSASTGYSVTGPMVISNATHTWATPSLSLAPGSYSVEAWARDSRGRSTATTEKFTILAPLTVITYGTGTVSIHNGTYLEVGSTNIITATPKAGQSFLSWNAGTGSFTTPSLIFPMSEGLTLTATFISNSLPGDLKFTYPAADAQVTTPSFILTGKIASSVASPQVVCQLFLNNRPLTDFQTATVSGTNWTLPVTNLGMGYYKAVAIATDATGKTTLASQSFLLNFFPNIAGYYHGLFLDPSNVSGTNAGSISFVLRVNGLLTGNLTFPVRNYVLYFYLGSTGAIQLYGNGEGPAGDTLVLNMNFDMTNFVPTMTGFVEQGGEVCPLVAYRATTKLSTNTVPSPGPYVLSFQPVIPTNGPVDGPSADSFAALTMEPYGSALVAGSLADGSTPFSLSTGVSTNGIWPIYASFYNGHGMLIGWETNLPSGQCNGTLFWSKSPTNGLYYTNGVEEALESVGAKYVAPPPGTNYQIVFTSDTLALPLTNLLTVPTKGLFRPAPGSTDKLTISLLPTGVINGTIFDAAENKTLTFHGVFLGPSTNSSGFILDTDKRAGSFVLSPL
jgi:uncharacterized protein (DUF2141 family)